MAGDTWLCAFPDGSSMEEGVLALLPQALGDLVLDKDWAPCVTEALVGPLRTLFPTQDYLQCLFAIGGGYYLNFFLLQRRCKCKHVSHIIIH